MTKSIKIKIEDKAVLNALKKASPEITRAAQGAIIDVNSSVVQKARAVHRFDRKTGDLQKATKQFEESANTFGVHIDETIASYGKYIHDGQRGWAPDRFLTNAFERAINTKKYSKKIVERVNRVLGRLF